ncbi:MAG: ECF transporter S component [Bacillota bacterium]
MRNENVKRLVRLGLLCALSVILMYAIRFPIFPAAPYLEYDMADVPILIGAFLFGPWWGLLLTLAVSVLQGITVSAASGVIGVAMHLVATGLFAGIAGLVYRKNRTLKGAIIGLLLGSLAMTLAMIPLNLTLTVYYNGVPYDVVAGMIVPIIIPFNLIKAGINSLATLLLYKSVASVLRLERIKAGQKQPPQ